MDLRHRQHDKPAFQAEFDSPRLPVSPSEPSIYAAVSKFHNDPLTGLIYRGRWT